MINGVERQMIKRNLKPKDIIGIAFDGVNGQVNFDLNNTDLYVNYSHQSLLNNQYFPTADLGLS